MWDSQVLQWKICDGKDGSHQRVKYFSNERKLMLLCMTFLVYKLNVHKIIQTLQIKCF